MGKYILCEEVRKYEKKVTYLLMAVVLLFSLSFFSQSLIHSFEYTHDLNNDNSGSTFELSERFVYEGKYSTIIVPLGGNQPKQKWLLNYLEID